MAASPSRAEVVEITAKWLFTKRDLRYLSVTGSVAAVASVLAFTSAQITAKQLQDYFDQAKKKPSRQFSDSATNVDVFVLEHSYIRVKVYFSWKISDSGMLHLKNQLYGNMWQSLGFSSLIVGDYVYEIHHWGSPRHQR